MVLGECEIRSTMSVAFPLATYPVCLKASPYWFACSSSSISSCCSSESAARPAHCRGKADIHILPCTTSMCAGADWGGWCNLTGVDVLWRFGKAQVDTASMDMLFKPKVFIYVHLCICITLQAVVLNLYLGKSWWIDQFAVFGIVILPLNNKGHTLPVIKCVVQNCISVLEHT